MFHTFRIPLTWRDLVSRTIKESNADNALGLAAQLAYYFLFALVPAIVCVVALASFLPPETIQQTIEALRRFAPGELIDIVRDQLTALANRTNEGVFTFGLLVALWSSSAAMVAITDALNRAYDIDEARPWWKVRLMAIALTVGVAIFVVAAFALLLMGPRLLNEVSRLIGFGPTFAFTWSILRWPLAFALVAFGIGLIYYFGPDAEQDWEWITPGAVLATVLWLLASVGFKLYASRFGSYNETYGSLGGVMIMMLWFYLTALAVLIGAEMNAEIEHASPHGKAPGEKVPGQKKLIGGRAAREFAERMRGRRSVPPAAAAASAPVAPDTSENAARPRRGSFAAYVVLGVGLWRSLRRARKPPVVH
jgi:membrane protein